MYVMFSNARNMSTNLLKDESKGKFSLAYATMSSLKWQLLGLLLPRAAMIGFNYSQTFLITATINYLERPVSHQQINHANGLIGAAVLIYLGVAVSRPSCSFCKS